MQNPYVLAAVRKQQRDRAMRLPPAQPDDWPAGPHAADFFDGLGAGGPKGAMIRNIRCTAAALRMSDAELAELLAFLGRALEQQVRRLRELGAPECIVANTLRPCLVLEREQRRRARA